MSSPSPTSRWRQPAPFPPRSGTRDPITVPANQLPFPDVIVAASAPSRLLASGVPVTPIISPASATEPLVAIPFQTWLQWQQELASRVPLSASEQVQASSGMMYQGGAGPMPPTGPQAGRGRRSQSVPRPPFDSNNAGYPSPYTTSQQHPPYQSGQVPYGTVASAPPSYPPYYPPSMGNQYQPPAASNRPVWLQQQQQQQTHHQDASSHSPTRTSTGATHPIRGLSSHPRPEVLDPLVSQLKKRRDPAPAPTAPKPSLSTVERYEWLAQYADRRVAPPPVPAESEGVDQDQDAPRRAPPGSRRAGGAPGTAHMHLPLGQPPPAFKPYTVTDYQTIKKADAVTRLPTSLGPPTDPESEARRAKAMAAHEYAERLRGMSRRQRSMTM